MSASFAPGPPVHPRRDTLSDGDSPPPGACRLMGQAEQISQDRAELGEEATRKLLTKCQANVRALCMVEAQQQACRSSLGTLTPPRYPHHPRQPRQPRQTHHRHTRRTTPHATRPPCTRAAPPRATPALHPACTLPAAAPAPRLHPALRLHPACALPAPAQAHRSSLTGLRTELPEEVRVRARVRARARVGVRVRVRVRVRARWSRPSCS